MEEEYKKGHGIFIKEFGQLTQIGIINKLKSIPTIYSHSDEVKKIIEESQSIIMKYGKSKDDFELEEIIVNGYGKLTINLCGISFLRQHTLEPTFIFRFCNF